MVSEGFQKQPIPNIAVFLAWRWVVGVVEEAGNEVVVENEVLGAGRRTAPAAGL